MAYNLYQVQMARAWAERIEKENAQAEKFWHEQVTKEGGSKPGSPKVDPRYAHSNPALPYSPTGGAGGGAAYAGSVAGSQARSAAPTGYTSKTSFLQSRLEKLEGELAAERESRKRVEEDLTVLRNSIRR